MELRMSVNLKNIRKRERRLPVGAVRIGGGEAHLNHHGILSLRQTNYSTSGAARPAFLARSQKLLLLLHKRHLTVYETLLLLRLKN